MNGENILAIIVDQEDDTGLVVTGSLLICLSCYHVFKICTPLDLCVCVLTVARVISLNSANQKQDGNGTLKSPIKCQKFVTMPIKISWRPKKMSSKTVQNQKTLI